MTMNARIAGALGFAVMMAPLTAGNAAEIKVVSSVGVSTAPATALIEQWTHRTYVPIIFVKHRETGAQAK